MEGWAVVCFSFSECEDFGIKRLISIWTVLEICIIRAHCFSYDIWIIVNINDLFHDITAIFELVVHVCGNWAVIEVKWAEAFVLDVLAIWKALCIQTTRLRNCNFLSFVCNDFPFLVVGNDACDRNKNDDVDDPEEEPKSFAFSIFGGLLIIMYGLLRDPIVQIIDFLVQLTFFGLLNLKCVILIWVFEK